MIWKMDGWFIFVFDLVSLSCQHLLTKHKGTFPANIYLLKVKNKNTRKRCKIYSKLTMKTPKLHH